MIIKIVKQFDQLNADKDMLHIRYYYSFFIRLRCVRTAYVKLM